MTRSADHVVKTGEQSPEDPYTFVMSSERKDRTGDIVRADGWELKDFTRNPIALFGHQHDFPIGTWKNVRVEGKRLLGDLVLAAEGTSARIDEIRSLVEQRILKAVSVGFRVKEYEPVEKDDPWGAWDIKKSELLETSVVSVPAHQDALATAKSLGVSKETLAIVFDRMSADQNRRTMSGEKRQTPSDIIGTPSHVLREQKRLRDAGLL